MLIAGPWHLRAILDEYAGHFSQHRPHRARKTLRPPDHDASITSPVTDLAVARIRRRKILGGLIHEYERPHDGHRHRRKVQVRDDDEELEPYTIQTESRHF